MAHEISGEDAERLIQDQISQHRNGIAQALAPLDAESSFYAWLDTIHAIEEFINLPLFGMDGDELEAAIVNLRLDALSPASLAPIRSALVAKFGNGLANRFVRTVLQASAIGASFGLHGLLEAAAGLQTVEHAIGYFQSRRRHLVSLLYTLPTGCRGVRRVEKIDALNQFLPQVEYSGITLTGLHQQLMLAKIFPDFTLTVESQGFTGNHVFEPLDAWFMEPERASIVEMQAANPNQTILDQLEPVDPRLIFSAAELRNNIRLIEATYAEFDLANSAFGPVAQFVRNCLSDCEDDYFVKLPLLRFDKLCENAGLSASVRRRIVHRGDDYVANTDVFAPFIHLSGVLVTTVTLLSRFLYYWRTVCLGRNRRFQIRSGFLFEASVKTALSEQGFAITDVKRINRKEFDVVAVLDDVIYNVQCKNNLVDLSLIETDLRRFVRYNRRLESYYAKALVKEAARENLLKDKLGLTKTKHMVVSRFPVATANPRIISYGRIAHFRAIATALPEGNSHG